MVVRHANGVDSLFCSNSLTGDEEAEEGKHESLVAMVGELRFTLIGDDGLVVGVGSREGEAKAEEENGRGA
jgi:hypothetical protein